MGPDYPDPFFYTPQKQFYLEENPFLFGYLSTGNLLWYFCYRLLLTNSFMPSNLYYMVVALHLVRGGADYEKSS